MLRFVGASVASIRPVDMVEAHGLEARVERLLERRRHGPNAPGSELTLRGDTNAGGQNTLEGRGDDRFGCTRHVEPLARPTRSPGSASEDRSIPEDRRGQ